jgi:hypothetical protein
MEESRDIWQKFIALPGAFVGETAGIASEQAIGGVIKVISKHKPKKILELGAGIGTLTYTALSIIASQNIYKDNGFGFFTIENNKFCLNQLPVNLKDFDNLYTVLPSTEVLPPGILFDFIIVDGGGDLDGDMGAMFFGNMLAQNGIILVEGGRAFQRNLIQEWYGARRHVSTRVPALHQTITTKNSGKKADNKPYYLYIFEPAMMNKFTLQAQGIFLNGITKIRRSFGTNR